MTHKFDNGELEIHAIQSRTNSSASNCREFISDTESKMGGTQQLPPMYQPPLGESGEKDQLTDALPGERHKDPLKNDRRTTATTLTAIALSLWFLTWAISPVINPDGHSVKWLRCQEDVSAKT